MEWGLERTKTDISLELYFVEYQYDNCCNSCTILSTCASFSRTSCCNATLKGEVGGGETWEVIAVEISESNGAIGFGMFSRLLDKVQFLTCFAKYSVVLNCFSQHGQGMSSLE